jgi:hypothetical protein
MARMKIVITSQRATFAIISNKEISSRQTRWCRDHWR